jgi:hypothetical protein
VQLEGDERDEDVLWTPKHVGPWWWMTEEPYIRTKTGTSLDGAVTVNLKGEYEIRKQKENNLTDSELEVQKRKTIRSKHVLGSSSWWMTPSPSQG